MVRSIRFGASGLVAGLCVAVAAAGQPARPFVHSLFQDHMVLQRGKPACVWGWTKPGATVRVELAGRSASAEADADGRWLARLGPFEAGGPHELKITGPQSVTVKDVLIGEVWVCSGQSNMQFNLGTIKDGGKAIREADDPTIRFLCLFAPNGEFGSKQPLEDLSVTKGDWQVCTPQTAGRCSATAYFFGRAIQRHLKVPVGLIVSALNGSPIEAWISKKALMALPVYSKGGRFSPDWDPNDTPVPYWYVPCARYNAQIRPLAPFAIRGFLFYQGETNAMWGRGLRYRELLPLLIRDWRECWGDESLPFIPIQLANTFGAQDPNRPFAGRCKWAEVQEAQLRARRVPHTETAVILDLCDGDLHPPNKPGIGERAARVARKVAYGEDLVVMGPTFREMKVEGGKARLYFDDLGGGLLSRDGRPLRFFNVAGEDKRFVVAEAAIDGETVVVSSPQVARPAAVRYAWATNPLGVNFLNRAGLPAPPFRTDDWNDESRPTAAFSHKTSGADAPVAVVFDGSKSRDPEQNIVSLAWDFGDGATATGAGPVHVFGKGGTYNVRLTVTDGDGLTDGNTVAIRVGAATGTPKPPMALLSQSRAGGTAPVEVAFDAGRSVDADGRIVKWAWDFGDGAAGEGAAVRHTFTKPGLHVVKLTLTDDQQQTATAEARVIAIGPGQGAGSILCERWRNVPGTDVKHLTSHKAFGGKPDDVTRLKAFEIPDNWGENYGTRVRGWLHPPATGEYTFHIASDDSSQLRLSPDEDPAGATVIAAVRGHSPRRNWAGGGERTSAPVRLVGGRRYYIEALHKEGGGSDYLAVAWEGPGLDLAVIDGLYLSPPKPGD